MPNNKTHAMASAPIMAVLAVLAIAPTASAAPLAELLKVPSPEVSDAKRDRIGQKRGQASRAADHAGSRGKGFAPNDRHR